MTRRSNRHDRHDAPLQRRAAARARSKCGGSAWPGGRALRLQRRAAPTHTAHAAVAPRKRSPAHLRMMMSETPPHPRPRQEREARVAPSVSSSAKRTTSLTSPPSPGDNVRNRGSTCGRSGVQRLRLWCRARSARPRPGCRIGAHTCICERRGRQRRVVDVTSTAPAIGCPKSSAPLVTARTSLLWLAPTRLGGSW